MNINKQEYLTYLISDLINSFPTLKFEKFNDANLKLIHGYYLYSNDVNNKMVGILSIDNLFIIRFNTPFEKLKFNINEPNVKLKIAKMLINTEYELKNNDGMIEWLLTDHLL